MNLQKKSLKMKKKIIKKSNQIKVFLFILAIIVIAFAFLNSDKAVATLNNEKITQSEVDNIKSLISYQTGQPVNDTLALNYIIANKLLQEEAKDIGIKVTNKDAEEILQTQLATQNSSVDQLKESLKENNQDYTTFIGNFKDQITAETLGQQILIKQPIIITEEESLEFFEKNKEFLLSQDPNVTYQDVSSLINSYLTQEKQQEIIQRHIDELRSKAEIIIA
jgi:parvulin-like peptidyl-prolyl isomerase